MRPPATKGNKKRDKLGDRLGDKKEHKLGDNGRQGETIGDNGRQGETRPREGRHVIQHRHTRGETIGDNGRQDPGRRTHHPTHPHMWGDDGRQGEIRPRKGGHTMQHRHTCGETMGNNQSQIGDKASGRRTHHPTHPHMWGDKGRQGEIRPGKADTRSNKGKQEGRLEMMEDRSDNYRRFGNYDLELTISASVTAFPRFDNYDSETTNPRFGNQISAI